MSISKKIAGASCEALALGVDAQTGALRNILNFLEGNGRAVPEAAAHEIRAIGSDAIYVAKNPATIPAGAANYTSNAAAAGGNFFLDGLNFVYQGLIHHPETAITVGLVIGGLYLIFKK